MLEQILDDLENKAMDHVETIVHRRGIKREWSCEVFRCKGGRYILTFNKGLWNSKTWNEFQWNNKYGRMVRFSSLVVAYEAKRPNDLVRYCMYTVFRRFGFRRFEEDLWAVN